MKKLNKKFKSLRLDIIGWAGVIFLLGSYILLSAGILTSHQITYHVLSMIGCLFVALEAWSKNDKQPAVLNFIFIGVALFALARIATIGSASII